MARLTHFTFISQRDRLQEIWHLTERQFAVLTAREQWDLHNFYVITQDMTDAELRLHRQVIKRVDPSLPQRAGRAFAKLERGEWKPIVHAVTRKERGITVGVVVKPKPDLERYAKAILTLAMEREGLTPSWARPQLHPLPPKRSGDGRMGDVKADTDRRK